MLRDFDRERGGAKLAAHKTGAVLPAPEFMGAHRDQHQNLHLCHAGALGARRHTVLGQHVIQKFEGQRRNVTSARNSSDFNSVNAMCNRSGDIILDIQPETDARVRLMLRKDAIAIRKHELWHDLLSDVICYRLAVNPGALR